jgi:hypothetical protein
LDLVTEKKAQTFKVKKDDILKGSIACIQNQTNKRELDVKISFHHLSLNDQGDQ